MRLSAALPVVLALVGMYLVGCTPKITEEQLQRLRELRAAERQLNQDIARKEAEKGRLQGELASRQRELQQCQSHQQFVREKLATWPNSWPDYTPAPPAPQEQPGVEIRTRKKPR
jgi:type II secretory pathway component PulJ